jgi:hypothetical protein
MGKQPMFYLLRSEWAIPGFCSSAFGQWSGFGGGGGGEGGRDGGGDTTGFPNR